MTAYDPAYTEIHVTYGRGRMGYVPASEPDARMLLHALGLRNFAIYEWDEVQRHAATVGCKLVVTPPDAQAKRGAA